MSPRGGPSPGKPVKRASSFDRFTRKSGGAKEAGAAAAPAQSFSKQLLFILLSRGPNGLGLELDATNTVINVVKGGAADVQGYFRMGDTIASVDGIPLRGRLLQASCSPPRAPQPRTHHATRVARLHTSARALASAFSPPLPPPCLCLLQEVMDPGKSSYSFDVWRLTRPDPTPPPQENKGVRRALSFDRKRR